MIAPITSSQALATAPQSHPAESDSGTESLGEEIALLSAQIDAATYRLLVLIREFDEINGWAEGLACGFKSCAHWLNWRTGLSLGAAREKVRVARALGSLPQLSAAMERGELSYSKVRAITRIATPKNEAEVLELAKAGTAGHIETMVRLWRRVDRLNASEEQEQEELRHHSRSLTLVPDDDGMWVLRGRLTAETGALLEKALEAGADSLFRNAATATPSAESEAQPTAGQRMADAVALVAEAALDQRGMRPRHDETGNGDSVESVPVEDQVVHKQENAESVINRAGRFEVVVHVDAEALLDGSTTGNAVLAQGIRVPAETSRRLSCDCGVRTTTHDRAGQTLDVGRRTRTVPPALRRALEHRDRTCRFPGCGSRYCDAHHIEHWADGGATKLHNLVLLCRRHHRAVHEEGWSVNLERSDSSGSQPVFRRPNGRLLEEAPVRPTVPAGVHAINERLRAGKIVVDAEANLPSWAGEPVDWRGVDFGALGA